MASSPAVLAAVGASQLNAKAPAAEDGGRKKRKRVEREGAQCREETIVIRRRSGEQNDARLALQAVVARSQIPLAYIDTDVGSKDRLPPIFCGTVEALCSEPQEEEGAVLVAEDEGSHTLFVIEKVQANVFALCKLHAWVTLEELVRGPAKRRRLARDAEKEVQGNVVPWWEKATVHLPKQEQNACPGWLDARKRFSARPPPAPAGEEARPSNPDALLEERGQAPANDAPEDEHHQLPTAEELFNAIRTHYLDSLYVSRTPLAYFAKGPLSRARAALRSSDQPGLGRAGLVDFLRSCIMTLGMGAKKYDTGLADLIRELPPGTSLEENESQLTTPIKDKLRKSRKRKKMTKLGLMPCEEEYLLRWWVRREESLEYAGLEDTRESRIKSGLSEQRARETQLQIILILETLALESAASKDGAQISETLEGAADGADQAKKKKPADLMNALDVLIDRLCIWESVNLDASGPGQKSQAESSSKASKALGTDQLRDFCTDVVVPYYATRLPDLYTSICQKLGGPSLTSSPPAMRTPAPKKAKKPATKKPQPAGASAAPTRRSATGGLVRSATDSCLQPTLKRELSSASLAEIPAHRPTLQESGRYARREVDLAAVARASEARAARKAAADAELRTAIAALRRPNPRAAVRDLVESADRRHAAQHDAKKRKARIPTRNPFAAGASDGVQVAATPKAGRQAARAAYALPPALSAPAPLAHFPDPDLPRPRLGLEPAEPRVPGSTFKDAAALAFPPLADTPARRGAPPGSEPDATPSRKRARVVPARRPTNPLDGGAFAGAALQFGRGGGVARSPLRRAYTMPLGPAPADSVLRTPSKPARQLSFVAELAEAGAVGDTPARAEAAAPWLSAPDASAEEVVQLISATGVKAKEQEAEAEQEQDIYAALGWNDDYDI